MEHVVFSIAPAGKWRVEDEAGRVLLDFDQRFRRRIMLTTVQGTSVLVDLPHAARLRDGDGLVLAAGGVIRVCAKPEALHEVSAPDDAMLMRIAWHLGNRHLPVQFLGGRIRYRADPVIADMVTGLSGVVRTLEAAFDPEAGAYASSAAHQHHHADDPHEH